MLKNNLNIVSKNLMMRRMRSLLNILGVMIGIVTFILVMLEVGNKLSNDKLFKNVAEFYWSYMDNLENEQIGSKDAQMHTLVHPAFENEFSGKINFVWDQLDQSPSYHKKTLSEVLMNRLADPFFLDALDNKIDHWAEKFISKTERGYWMTLSLALLIVLIVVIRRKRLNRKIEQRIVSKYKSGDSSVMKIET